MATNLHAALRYNVLDRCFRDREHNYHWRELSQRCYDELIVHYPDYKAPSRRSIMDDIYHMRYGVLGYEAPIEYDRIEGYHYSNPRFTIHNVALSSQQLQDMQNAVALLKQLTNNTKLAGITTSIEAIQQRLNLIDTKRSFHQIIYFEESLNFPGHQWIDILYTHIQNQVAIRIDYEPFDKPAKVHLLSPRILKEYNNRWFIIGYEHDMQLTINLALDRICSIKESLVPPVFDTTFDIVDYYRNVFGVTILPDSPIEQITFIAKPLLSRYLDTKPIHPTQIKLSADEAGSTYQLQLVINYEIIQKLFSYGNDIKVTGPQTLIEEFRKKATEMNDLYLIP